MSYYQSCPKLFFQETLMAKLKTLTIIPGLQSIAVLFALILFSSALYKSANASEVPNAIRQQMFPNPLYDDFVKIGKAHKLDLSFTKMAWAQKGGDPSVWGPNSYKINTLFNEKPKSIDILFIGDCTIAWGMIPKVIEQMTGKKVGFYAYASNVLTVKTTRLFEKIAKYYLKKDGILVYSFSNWALQKDSNFIGTSLNEYNEIVGWYESDFKKFAEKNKEEEYWKAFASYVAPREQRAAIAKQNRGIEYLRWDMDSITEYSPAFSLKSVHSEIMPTVLTRHGALINNADAAAKVFTGDKVFMVPLYSGDQHYLASRTIYYSYYQKLGFKVADMGLFLPKEEHYTMENHRHVANTGGLMMSILIGKWFRQYLSDPAIGNGREINFSFLGYYKERLQYLIDHSPKGSMVYLPVSWADKKIVEFMQKNDRKVITELPKKHNDFYYLSGTINEAQVKGYGFQSVYRDTLGSYLRRYKDAVIVLSIMDDGSYSLSDETKQYLRETGIDIDKLKFAGSLAALIDNGKAVVWKMQNKAPVSLDPKILARYGIQKVMSAGSHWGNSSEIIVNGGNYSKQRRGFNYLIKKRDGTLINGFVDTYEKDEMGDSIMKAVAK